MEYQEAEFRQSGAIVRLKFINFMQYSDTEFHVGPNLNVIIGPNGSGKSTIVNGICIGLAGKCSVLGRATSLGDFILVGRGQASTEIELHSNEGNNLIVQRTWNHAGRSEWLLNKKKCTEKEVKDRVAKLRIQVDNLCQFLPQDKVHDFSRLNNKGLLDSTVDAVGDMELKEKHQQLKELKTELEEGEHTHESQMKILSQKTSEHEKLEDEVKAFREKRLLLERIDKLGKKRLWNLFENSRRNCKKATLNYEEKKKVVDDNEKALKPLRNEVTVLKKKLDTVNRAQLAHGDLIKENLNKAKVQSQRVDKFAAELEDFKNQLQIIDRREKEKEATIEKCQQMIRSLEQEIEEHGEDETMQEKLIDAKKNTKKAMERLDVEKEKLAIKKYEVNSIKVEQERIEKELVRLRSVEERKFEILKRNSNHASQAVNWLRKNRDRFSGEVYEPFILSANVIQTEHAIYIENMIGNRDLSVFFFERTDDMNLFLNETRQRMGLERVGAALVPRAGLDHYVPRVSNDQLRQYGLVGYLKDMVEAPDGVLAYMCQQYNLHNTAVFQPSAEKYNDVISGKFGITKYFFGTKLQIVSRSNYSGKAIYRTSQVQPHGVLALSLDHDQINRLNEELQKNQMNREEVDSQVQSMMHDVQQCSESLEACRKEQRALEQKRSLIAKNRSLIENQRKRIREAMSNDEEERERKKINEEKITTTANLMQTGQLLKNFVVNSAKARTKKDIKALEANYLESQVNRKEHKITDLRESMKEARQEMDAVKQVLDELSVVMVNTLKEAREMTGSSKGSKDKPPEDLVAYWVKEDFPDGVEQIELLTGQLEAQAASTEDVDQSVLDKYRDLQEEITELRQAMSSEKKSMESRTKKIDRLKTEWLGTLNQLISDIDQRFERFFSIMGFFGKIELTQGNYENDFDNFGIRILVKYRETDPLQELTPHLQSGGERSVATAIYMLALQALTTVPFRCVDEINQGMDTRNERLIFEMLVETSCNQNSAQYFLLTPKLLGGLKYNPRMNVLTVHTGTGFPHHSRFNLTALG